MLFADRRDAGRRLAEDVRQCRLENPVVLGLARGGVPVAFEVARAVKAPLDVILVRKIGAPGQEELAVGAVVDGSDPELVIDRKIVAALHVSDQYLEHQKTTALAEIERRRRVYLGGRAPIDVTGCTVIVVDDGIATGTTMAAALRATRRRQPAALVLAVPVAARASLAQLRLEADRIVCPQVPSFFAGVGQFYGDFTQVADEEVIALLATARTDAARG